MIAALVWVLVITGVALTFRAARTIADSAPCWLAAAALLIGQFAAFRPSLTEALIFVLCAAAVERGQALWRRAPTVTAALAIVPPAAVLIHRLGMPSIGNLADVWFCSQHGVAATSAIVWIGLVGLAADLMTGRRVWIWTASLFFVTVVAAGHAHASLSWRDASGAFISGIPIVGLGLARLAQTAIELTKRHPARAVATLALPLVIWNLTLLAVAQAGTLRIGEAVSFGVIGQAQARTLHAWIGHPFALPDSLVFAIRNRQPMSRFDVLGSLHIDPSRPIAIDVGPNDSAYIAGGWHAPELDGDHSYRWTMAGGEIRLPALPAGRVRVRIHAKPFAPAGQPAQTVTIVWGDRSSAATPLAADWTWLEFELDIPSTANRVTTLVLQCDHAISPKAANLGGDPRELGIAVDKIEIILQ